MTAGKSPPAAVQKLLRKTALKGSDRPIDFDLPVGGSGLGLDSLALVEFVVAFEKEFRIEVPETIWTRLAEITPRYFVDLLEARGPSELESRGFLGKFFRKESKG